MSFPCNFKNIVFAASLSFSSFISLSSASADAFINAPIGLPPLFIGSVVIGSVVAPVEPPAFLAAPPVVYAALPIGESPRNPLRQLSAEPIARKAAALTQPDLSSRAEIGPAGGGQTVRASWYGGGNKLSRKTANGEAFHAGGLTAAHRTLPFGTRVKVSFHGRSVVVRINDRGPAARTKRGLDLSRGAADALGMRSKGVASVQMLVLR